MFVILLASNPYIPWDTNMFLKAVGNLRSVIGTAFNVGFWIFIIIMGIVLVKNIVEYFAS